VINIMAAGTAEADWPNQPKAHLMMAYLRETYKNNTTLSRVAAKRDLEKCTMKKDEDPKVLFDRLTAVQFKYQGNVRANITEDDLVTQAVQALPAIYNSTVAGLFERLPNAVTFAVLRRAVGNHYSIAMKGKSGNKTKDIEGGFAAMETQGASNDKDDLKRMIKDTINATIRKYQGKINATTGNQVKLVEQGHQQSNKSGNKGNQGAYMNLSNAGNANYGLMPEAVMAILEATQG
jgi:gag-polypeptide of LTR copia-type